MVEVQRRDNARAFALGSVVLAVLGGAWSFIGAWIPGGFAGLVAAILGFLGQKKARASGTSATLATTGLLLGALVLVASLVLVVTDSS